MKLVSTHKTITKIFFGIFFLFVAFKSIAYISSWKPVKSYFPTEINSIKSTVACSIFVRAAYINDSVHIRYFISRPTGAPVYQLGSSNLVLTLDPAYFDLANAKIVKRSAWDEKYNPNAYRPLSLGFNNVSQILSLNIEQKTIVPIGVTPPLNDSLLAEVTVPVIQCVSNYAIRWSRSTPQGEILNFLGKSIYNETILTDAPAIDACPCNAAFTGLATTYCTSGFLSKLIPTFNGGIFTGAGVRFASNIWYFNPFDAGPGEHIIKYILPCGDTVSKKITVQAAPCQSLSGVNETFGYVAVRSPTGIFTDCLGQIYTTSAADQAVYKIDTFGIKTLVAGTVNVAGYQDGSTTTAKFEEPAGITVSSTTGLIYVVDSKNQVIRQINPFTNQVSTLSGTKGSTYGTVNDDGATGGTSRFSTQIIGLTFDKTQTNLYVTESSNGSGGVLYNQIRRIRKVDINTGATTTIAGGAYGTNVADFDNPASGLLSVFRSLGHISADDTHLYVADPSAKKIKKIALISPNGVSTVAGGAAFFSRPLSASVSSNGVIYTADQNDYTVKEIIQYPSVSITTVGGISGDDFSANSFASPNATSVFVKGFIDVADAVRGTISRIGIKDYGSLPFKGSSKDYCYNGVTDTLNYIIGSYTGAGVSKINNIWVFNPILAGIGKHVIKYSFDLNSCNSTFADTFIVHPKPKPFKGLNKVICNNELGRYKLDAGPGKTFAWYKGLAPAQLITGQNTRFLLINNTGTYSVRITDTLGCFGGDTISISTIPSSSISLGADINLCAGFKAALTFSPTAGVQSVLWQDSTTNLVDTAYGGGVYHVTVKDANGCFASDTLNVISSLPPTPLISSDPAEKCVAFVKTKALFPKENTFLTPQLQGMVIDKLGNTYITDYENNLIRKIDKFGNRTIYAGTGSNQLGTSVSTVKLSGPYGITIDRNQNIFITEVKANIVRKITPNGVVSIYAGVYGMSGFNGEANKDSVLLWQPTGIDTDDIGNIYITEYERHIVRKISPVGYTQIIGDINSSGDATGGYNQARFNRPQALTIDKAGYIYVADLNKNIKKIDPFAKKVTVYTTLPASVSTNVKGLTIDNFRRMYFTMNTNYTVYYVDPRDSSTVYYAGVSNVSGSTDGLMTTAKFQDLQGLYINENGGALYAVDKNTVRIITDSCGVTICEGYVATLTANKHNSYEWNNNAAQAVQSIQVGTAGKYFVKVGNSVGCTFYDSIQVSVIPKPLIKVTKDTVVCVGDSSVISANVSPITANDTIIWRRNGKVIKQTIGLATNTVKVGAGVYTAEVRTAKLCVYYATSRVDSIRPILDAYAPIDTVCQGQAVQLKVDVEPGSYKPALKFRWTGEIVNGDTVQNPTANPLSANKNKYVVKVTDANGCFNIDTAFIFVKARPIITTLKDTNVCLGSTIVLFTNVSGGKEPYKSLYWSPTAGLSNPNIKSPSVTPTDSIVYEISVTDADNCTSRDDIKIGVIKFEVSPATTDADTLCPNSKAQLNVTASKGSGNYKYQWSPASGLSSAIIKNPVAQPTATTEYSVVVTDNVFYCQQTRSVKVNTLNLSVNTGNDVKTCIGSAPVELQANTIGGTKPYSYIWTPVAGLNNPNIANPKISTNKISTVRYIVTVNDAGGCTDKDTISVTITDKPVIKASNDTLICADVRFTISALLTNATFPADITWTNNKNLQVLKGNTVNISPTDSINYNVSAVDANGCVSNLDSITLAVIKLKASVTALPTSICPNTSSQLNTKVAGGIGKLTYTWLPTINLDNASIASPKATLNATTKFAVTVIDSIGCIATDTARVVVSDLKINAGADKKLCLGTTYQLGAAISGGATFSKVSWTPATGLNVTNVLNPTFTSNTIGKNVFVVKVEDVINCTNSDTVMIEIAPAPIADAGLDLALCFGTTASIGGKPTATGGAGAPYQYAWTTINATSGLLDATVANPVVTASSDVSYLVTVKDASECTDSDTVVIAVNKLPLVSISKNKETACAPESVILSIVNPSGNNDYNWKALPSNDIKSTSSTFEVFKNGDYRAIVVDKLTLCKDSAVANVAFINPPTNLFINVTSALCINSPIALEGSALGDELVYSWKTSNGKGKFTNSAISNTLYNPNELLDPVAPNAISIRLIVSNACKSDSISKNIFLSPTAKPSFKTDAKETLLGDPMAFYNITDTLNKGPLTYQWFFGDGSKSSTFNAAHIYPDAGEYLVMLVAKNTFNCLDTATLLVDIIGTQILYIPNAFSPSADNFENKTSKVYGTALANDGFEWTIYNRWGEIIYNTTIAEEAKTKGWNGNFKNDGEALPAGVFTYTLKVKLANSRLIEKTGTISLIR